MSKMPGLFESQAIERVRGYLANYGTDQPAEILADILHYCNNSGINIHDQLKLAQGYVDEELSVDTEL
jgi:hypothetical protein